MKGIIPMITMFDVGARGGIHERWTPFHDSLTVCGFEPEPIECETLNRAASKLPYQAVFLPYALGRVEGTTKFYECTQPGCSSIYEPNAAFVAPFAFAPQMAVERVSTVTVHTLDAVCQKEQRQPDVLKLDVQGAELDILEGGVYALNKTKMVELEVEFNPQYIAAPLFHDVDRFMIQQGFRLLGLRRDYWRRTKGLDRGTSGCGGTLVHGDALYYNAHWLEQRTLTAADVRQFAALFSAYRQNDFVVSVLQHHALRDLRREDALALECAFVHRAPWWGGLVRLLLSQIPHRTRRGLLDAIQPGSVTDWHDADFY